MKMLEELAVEPKVVREITPQVISRVLLRVAEKKTVFAQFYKDNRDLVGSVQDHIVFIKEKSDMIKIQWGVDPGKEVTPESTFGYETTTISVVKSGIKVKFPRETLRRGQRDVLADFLYRAGRVYAEKLDDVAEKEMMKLTEEKTDCAGLIEVTVTAPIYEIISYPGTIAWVDYEKGKVKFEATISAGTLVTTYPKYQKDAGLWIGVKKAGSLSAWDILQARYKLIATGRNPDVLIMNDGDLPSLLYDEKIKFLDVSAYGAREALLNAEIGKILGLRVVTSNRMALGSAIVLDSDRLGYHVIQRELEGQRDEELKEDSVYYYYWAEQNFGAVDTEAAVVIVNAHSQWATIST